MFLAVEIYIFLRILRTFILGAVGCAGDLWCCVFDPRCCCCCWSRIIGLYGGYKSHAFYSFMKKEGLPNIFILYVRWKQFFKFWVLLVSSSSLARNSYLQRFVVYFLLQFTYFKLENLRFTPIHIMYSRTRICLVNSFRYLSSYDSISRH